MVESLSPSSQQQRDRELSIESGQSSYRQFVGGDIESRIRSLLLSRNDHRPPKTPYASPQERRSSLDSCAAAGRPNFSIVRGDATCSYARMESSSISDSAPLLSPKEPSNLDGELSRSISDQDLARSRRPTFLYQKTDAIDGSSDKVRVAFTDPPTPKEQMETTTPWKLPYLVLEDKSTSAGPNTPKELSGIKPPFRLPHLVLEDKVDSNISPAPNISKEPRVPFSLPRLVLRDKKPANPFPVRSCGSANGDDLACFIAGCTHMRRTPLEIAILREEQARRFREATKGDSQLVARNVTGEAAKQMVSSTDDRSKSVALISPGESIYSQEGIDSPNLGPHVSEPFVSVDRPQSHKSGVKSRNLDIQPHPEVQRVSTVVTKFSLPDHKTLEQEMPKTGRMDRPLFPKNEVQTIELVRAAYSVAPVVAISKTKTIDTKPAELVRSVQSVESLRSIQQLGKVEPAAKRQAQSPPEYQSVNLSLAQQVEAAFRTKPRTPSLLSGASKGTTRHALLKSSAAGSPADNGLPAPPVLSSTVVAAAEKSSQENNNQKDHTSKADRRQQRSSALENLQKAQDLVAAVESQLRTYKLTTSVTSQTSAEATEANQSPSEEQGSGVVPVHASVSDVPVLDEPAHSVHVTGSPNSLAYWGFAPGVKEGLQWAVQNAVRRAVRKITVPPGNDAEEASAAYRKLLGESLSQAATIADAYIARDSFWKDQANNKLSSISGSNSAGSLSLQSPESVVGDTSIKSRSHDKEILFFEDMDVVPLRRVDDASEQDHFDAGAKVGKRCKYGSGVAYTAIPTRHSSQKHSSGLKSSHSDCSALSRLRNRDTGLDAEGTKEPSLDSIKNAADDEPVSTVHWIKDLLSSSVRPYESRLTEMPPRTGRQSLSGRTKSQSVSHEPVQDASPSNIETDRANADTANQMAVAETFTNTINDLESLLNEALFIARKAIDKEDPGYVPTLLGNAAAVLKDGRKEFRADLKCEKTRVHHSSPEKSSIYHRKLSDEISDVGSLPSVHESLRSTSGSDASYDSNEDEIEHLSLVTISLPRKPTEVDIGFRSKTPFPPSSARPSNGDDMLPPAGDKAETKPVNPELFGMIVQHPTEEIPPPKTERKETVPGLLIRADTNPFSGSTPSRQRRESSKVSPLQGNLEETLPAKSRAVSGSVQSERRISQNGKDVIFIDDHAIPESIHGPSRPEAPPTILGGSILRLGNDTRVESITPSSEAGSLLEKIRKTLPRKSAKESPAPPHVVGSPSFTQSYDGSAPTDAMDFDTGYSHKQDRQPGNGNERRSRGVELKDDPAPGLPTQKTPPMKHPPAHLFDLKGKNHLSLSGSQHGRFSLTRSHKKPKIARDWSTARKRFVATVACISTALVGILVGIYAAEVPAIQYYIVDFHHYVILGNVFFYIGLAISTFFFWPLPLLHGRKPYILGAMCLAMPLLFPQALAVGDFRSPYTAKWRVALLLPRSFMGLTLGFANMNFKSTLTDLFGASLMAANPHQEIVDENDVRRHGGGLGVWLGIWTWSAIGSIGIGFLFGAIIINNAPPAWGFYISICIIAAVMLLNVVCPEVRRSAFRRSVAEVKNGDDISRRLARGEVKMHMVKSGPKWWGEEFHYGVMLSMKMLRQPGFMVLAVYVSWIYGQIVLIVVLLGSLLSKYYKFESPYIGASVMAMPVGAALGIPFQKAGLFSRERTHAEISDDDTRDEKPGWSSHLVRRAIFVICLPFAGLGYTLTSSGPPVPWILPILFAGLFGFLSSLALAECHGLIMETYDTSDLQPGMAGRPRKSSNDKNAGKRTNYSSFPRVCSGFAIVQCLGYLIAAVATGVGGVATRNIGQQAATGVMAGILLILSILLLLVLMRFRYVQIVPNSKKEDMAKYMEARRKSAAARGDDLDDESLRPIIIGNPTHHTRRMNILELGSMSRFSEIRRKNHLVDSNTLEAKHPNLAMIRDVEERLREEVGSVKNAFSPTGSRRSRKSKRSILSDPGPRGESFNVAQMDQVIFNDQADLGGRRETGNGSSRTGTGSRRPTGSFNRSKSRRKTTIQE